MLRFDSCQINIWHSFIKYLLRGWLEGCYYIKFASKRWNLGLGSETEFSCLKIVSGPIHSKESIYLLEPSVHWRNLIRNIFIKHQATLVMRSLCLIIREHAWSLMITTSSKLYYRSWRLVCARNSNALNAIIFFEPSHQLPSSPQVTLWFSLEQFPKLFSDIRQ